MQNRTLLVLNGVVALITAVFLFTYMAPPGTTPAAPQIEQIPGPAAFTRPDKELAFVVFPERDAAAGADSANVTVFAQPLQADGRVDNSKPPRELLKQPDPPGCMTDSLHPSPNGRFLLIQYNCESTLFARVLNVTGQAVLPVTLPAGYILDWSPDGDYLLFRDMDADEVLLIASNGLMNDRQRQLLALPEGTYSAIFAPDGAQIHYAASKGLGFGTERGIFDLAQKQLALVEEFPRYIIGTPRWSPDGSQLAYMRMPDSNVPFTVGELWLADENGRVSTTLFGDADAGHGYAPVWSPDGRSVLFVQRENAESSLADYAAHALRSNLYQVNIDTGRVTALTAFKDSLVHAPAWSADGRRLAFAANDAVWTVEMPGGEPVQVSPADSRAQFPVWLPDPGQ